MAYSVSLAGSTYVNEIEQGDFSIEWTLGQRTTATIAFVDPTSATRPTIGETAVIKHDADTVFVGLVAEVEEEPLTQRDTGLRRRLSCVGLEAWCDRRLVNQTFAAGQDLETVLGTLVTNYLSTYGVALSTDQPAGSTLAELTYDYRPVTDVLNELATVTGDVWSIWTTAGATPTLKMVPVGTDAAPVNITTTAYHCETIRYRLDRNNYRNQQYVRLGSVGAVWKTDVSTADGAQRNYVLRYTPVAGAPPSVVTVTSTDPVVYPVGAYGVDTMEWTYTSTTVQPNLIHSTSYAVLGAGTKVECSYNAQFPLVVSADSSSEITTYGVFEHLVEAPETYDRDLGEAIAEGLIRRYASSPKVVTFVTTEIGFRPGQQITITLPSRDIDNTFLITSVRSVLVGPNTLRSTVECVEGAESAGTFLDLYRQWSGLSGGASASVLAMTSTDTTGSGSAQARTVWPLGGASFAGSRGSTWVDVENQIPVTMPAGVGAGVVYCRVRAQSTGISVTPRLISSSGSTAGVGVASTASSWVNQSFAVTLTPGQVYTLQVLPESTDEDVFALGYLDAGA
ncbi:MAG: hypothetical protein PHR30_16495 [Gallionellaceae bacterium]|nr:hypothetical protein [Gallionellaceae bacterium]